MPWVDLIVPAGKRKLNSAPFWNGLRTSAETIAVMDANLSYPLAAISHILRELSSDSPARAPRW